MQRPRGRIIHRTTKATVAGVSTEESIVQDPRGNGGGMMADDLVLKATVRAFAFTPIIREPWEGCERGGMPPDLGFIRISLVVL